MVAVLTVPSSPSISVPAKRYQLTESVKRMQTILISDIVVLPNRQRQVFNEQRLRELADSIEDKGLMQAIVLRDDHKTLVAGERRIKACSISYHLGKEIRYDGTVLPTGKIPYVTLSQLDAIKLKEAELEENVRRDDLTWQERVAAERELHFLRIEQTGGEQTIQDTAAEIYGQPVSDLSGSAKAGVSDSILIAGHLDDPEVAAAKSPREAKKIISKKLERVFQRKLVETLGEIQSDHRAVLGDCVDALRANAGQWGKFDVLITDPPYGVDASGFGSQATTSHEYKDSWEDFTRLQQALAPEAYAALKDDAHAYVFCDPRNFPFLASLYAGVGFRVWPVPLIWYKGESGMLPEPDFGPRRCYEAILFARKGNRHVTGVYSDVLHYPSPQDKVHGAQKPIEVYIDLLKRSCYPGDKVLDTCMGSGTIFPAATRLSLRATGIEIAPDIYSLALQRINSKE